MENKLTKKYGLFTAICMVVGIVIGSGIFFKTEAVLSTTGGNVLTGVLGLLYSKTNDAADDIEALVQQRQEARKAKNWKEADRIRDLITSMGYILEDTPQGAKVRKA